MYKTVTFAVSLMLCLTNTWARVNCGATPVMIYACMDSPKVVAGDVMEKCVFSSAQLTECEKVTCIYRESGWLDGTRVKKEKVWYHYDRFAVEHPEWDDAIQFFKTYCLEDNLLPQGIYLNCLPYDITHCAFIAFIKKARPNQWLQTADCTSSRDFAATCPVCPTSCLTQTIPNGSCNACFVINQIGHK